MKASEIIPGSPERLAGPAGPDGGGYRLDDDLLAVHASAAADPVVVPATTAAPRGAGPAGELGPVYRRDPGGDVVVPTGRVLVRFAGDESAAERTAALAGAGYRLEETLGYAPGTVWARAAAGGIVASLRNLGALSRRPEVRSAQPELIGERSWRS